MTPRTDRWKRRLFIIAGTIALGIGVVGIIIPVLPTTPFLLLAAICYMRGSLRLYNVLLRNRFIGSYVRNYLEGRGMPFKMKIWTLTLLWIAVVCTAVLATSSAVVRTILAVVLIGVTIHILKVKTLKKETGTRSNNCSKKR
ncbi:YbaN family protein [Chloroflexota bacterium]